MWFSHTKFPIQLPPPSQNVNFFKNYQHHLFKTCKEYEGNIDKEAYGINYLFLDIFSNPFQLMSHFKGIFF